MEIAPSLQDLQEKVEDLHEKPYQDHWNLLKEVGVYFRKFEPRRIDPDYVKLFASYLNELHGQMEDNGNPAEETENILQILGKINTQCHKIETQNLDDDYFMNYKRLGTALVTIADQWGNSIDADTSQMDSSPLD